MTKTSLVRFPTDIKKELERNYPQNKMPELIRVMYNSSALKLDSKILNMKRKYKL